MKVNWVNRGFEGSTFDVGWATVNRELLKQMPLNGIEHDWRSPLAFHVSSPRVYAPLHGRRNVVYSLWESNDFPKAHRPNFDKIDHLITGSEFCREIFADKVKCDVEVVPLGVDASLFTYGARGPVVSGESFQWLNVGSPNARKGWDVIENVWNKFFYGRLDCHLYCKMTTAPYDDVVARAVDEGFVIVCPGVVHKSNIILDFRKLSTEDLVETYKRSNGFVFPTAAEGFGLSLLEAMATGLPCIVTKYSGVLDYTHNDTVKYVDWTPYGETYSTAAGHRVILNSALADSNQVAVAMEDIMNNYPSALMMGKRASDSARKLTWEETGKKIARILRKQEALLSL